MKKIKNEWAICDFADACLNTVRVIIALVFFGFLVSVMILGLNDVGAWVDDAVNFEELDQDIVYPGSGVGRAEVAEVPIYTAGAEVTEKVAELSGKPTIEIYKEGDDPKPVWYQPTEKMSVEWVGEKPKKDIASPDWNLNTSIVGADGRKIEMWELDTWARVFYLEFWGASEPCCEAGCDAMLNLWGTGLYGKNLSDTLWGLNAQGKYIYSVWPDVWITEYDSEGLQWCKDFCLERFTNGVEWEAVYFQKWGFHSTTWTIPLYMMDGVYFSKGK